MHADVLKRFNRVLEKNGATQSWLARTGEQINVAFRSGSESNS
jgi:hypothetical protein